MAAVALYRNTAPNFSNAQQTNIKYYDTEAAAAAHPHTFSTSSFDDDVNFPSGVSYLIVSVDFGQHAVISHTAITSKLTLNITPTVNTDTQSTTASTKTIS